MLLKDSIEQAFGYDAEERIFHFLVKDELSDCGGDTARWLRLFYEIVSKQWEEMNKTVQELKNRNRINKENQNS